MGSVKIKHQFQTTVNVTWMKALKLEASQLAAYQVGCSQIQLIQAHWFMWLTAFWIPVPPKLAMAMLVCCCRCP